MKQKLLLLLAISISMVSSAWALDPVNGLYKISSKQDLFEFAAAVNGGDYSAAAILTADIDLNNEAWTPIGNASHPYTGTFDGLGHEITGFNLTTTANQQSFFGQLGDGAIVKNFTIDGSVNSATNNSQHVGGVIGGAGSSTGTVTISNIHSKVHITCSNSRHGGILGTQTSDGTVNIDRCRYSGTLDAGNTTGNLGGIVGFTRTNASAKFNITNCLFDGTINDGTGDNAGGIVGYTNSTKVTITNCLSKGSITASKPGQFFGQLNASNSKWAGKNYYVSGNLVGNLKSGVTISGTAPSTAADLTTGEICVQLNDADHGTNWYQTLETDDYPNPIGGNLVYKYNSYSDCNAATGTGDISYTNSPTVPSHSFTDGFCTTCSALDNSYMTPVGGYYEIGTAAQLKWFSAWLNSDSYNFYADAKLTADIDMTSIAATWIPIGDWGNTSGTSSAAYKGHFNGQGHAITNFNTNPTTQNYFALFGVISAGCLIENFSVSGTITNGNTKHQYVGGVAAYSRDQGQTIRNVKSAVNIYNNVSGSGRHAGILAGALNGTTTIQNCTYTGTIQVDGIAGNYGGIVGYANNNTNAHLTISNCLFDGTVEDINGGEGECGGIIGFASTSSDTKIENCLSVGTVSSTKQGMICGIIAGTKTFTNNFYKDDDDTLEANGPSSNAAYTATAVTTAELARGEVAYLLNGSVNAGTNWYQTLPASPSGDATPTLDSTHGLVYINGTVCPDTGAPQGSVSYSNAEGTTTGSHNYTNGFCSYCDYLQSDYMTPSDGWYMIGNEKQLKWFAAFVNLGGENMSANAVLTNDIDMEGETWPEPIGYWVSDIGYKGHFDGQGYKIENLKYTTKRNYHGLFGVIWEGAIVENFSISGDVTNEAYDAIAPVAYSKNSVTPVYIRNIHSYLNITSSGNDKKVGGILGNGNNGTTYVDRCIFSGTLSSTNKTNCGGIVAYIQNNSSALTHITNCVFEGRIESTADNAYCGGIVGYIGANSAVYTITNCLSIGTFDAPVAGSIFGYVRNKGAGSSNNYIISGGITHGMVGDNCSSTDNLATEVTTSQLASGEITYKLGAAFYQTLTGVEPDTKPTLDSSHGQVILNGDYENVASTLALDEDDSFGTNSNFDVTSVTMNRTLKGGKWNTFCVPFDMDADEIEEQLGAGTEVKKLIGVTDNGDGNYTLTFSEASSIVAGKPYMVRVPSEVTSISLSSKTIKGTIIPITVDDITFTGVFNNGNAPEDSYIISNNKFYQVNSTVALKAFRGYLAVGGGGEVKELNYFIEDDDADGIDMVNGEGFMVNGPIYNLSGQRINKLQKGINIVNGKKVLF